MKPVKKVININIPAPTGYYNIQLQVVETRTVLQTVAPVSAIKAL